jgi:hypothetical protein
MDQGWRGRAVCTGATRGVRGLQGSWSDPGLEKERPREGASGHRRRGGERRAQARGHARERGRRRGQPSRVGLATFDRG